MLQRTVNSTWCPVSSNCIGTTQAGFPGIGAASGDTGGFTGIFEGNGNSISNFYSRNTANTNNANIGLFTVVNSGGTIRNIAVVNANLFGGTALDRIGGLVGFNNTGTIIASSASGSADGGDGNFNAVGGLVGNNVGSIIASYATGSADGGVGASENVGGLVGSNAGTITASYATVNANGGDGGFDQVGGLVGRNETTIIASYATGIADGGAGNDEDYVGGLVGIATADSNITASYATGDADGGDGLFDFAGSLVGTFIAGSTITASYGFGTADGETDGPDGSPPVTTASALTALNAGTSASLFWWNEASSTGAGAWNFGDGSENPALVYSDYDGDASDDYPSCSDAEGLFLTIPGTTTQIVCGTTLIGGDSAQGR